MNERLQQFREGMASVGARRAGRKFPREMMAIASDYAHARRSEKASWRNIADELGVTVASVQRWAEVAPASAAGFKAVRVVEPARRDTFTVTIGAVRVDGLAFDMLVALAKALS
jgi:hypothetical protein